MQAAALTVKLTMCNAFAKEEIFKSLAEQGARQTVGVTETEKAKPCYYRYMMQGKPKYSVTTAHCMTDRTEIFLRQIRSTGTNF